MLCPKIVDICKILCHKLTVSPCPSRPSFVVSPLITPPPPSTCASASHHTASHHAPLAPLVWLVVVSLLITPPPPIHLRLRLSSIMRIIVITTFSSTIVSSCSGTITRSYRRSTQHGHHKHRHHVLLCLHLLTLHGDLETEFLAPFLSFFLPFLHICRLIYHHHCHHLVNATRR